MVVRYVRWLLVGLMVVVGTALVAGAQIGGPTPNPRPIPGPVDNSGPTINIWYGPSQNFGQNGMPVPFINVLGNVSDPSGVDAIGYSLNGGPLNSLSLGPDQKRLADPGDFNVEIEVLDLIDGDNKIQFVATDSLDNTTFQEVDVTYEAGNVWPLPYFIEWDTVSNVQDVAQVLDGNWELTDEGVKPLQLNYDRLIAIGDMEWTDYEVTVPITVNGIDSSGFEGPSKGAAVGVLLRWPGHSDLKGERPREGFAPHGAAGILRWEGNPIVPTTKLQIFGNQQTPFVLEERPFLIDFTTYIFKMRVTTVMAEPPVVEPPVVEPPVVSTQVGGLVPNSLYQFKIWEAGQPEPTEWTLSAQEGPDDVQAGSLLLLAHHVDCVFGNVNIVPITESPVTEPPVTAPPVTEPPGTVDSIVQ